MRVGKNLWLPDHFQQPDKRGMLIRWFRVPFRVNPFRMNPHPEPRLVRG